MGLSPLPELSDLSFDSDASENNLRILAMSQIEGCVEIDGQDAARYSQNNDFTADDSYALALHKLKLYLPLDQRPRQF